MDIARLKRIEESAKKFAEKTKTKKKALKALEAEGAIIRDNKLMVGRLTDRSMTIGPKHHAA